MGKIRESCCTKIRRNKKAGFDCPILPSTILLDDIEKTIILFMSKKPENWHIPENSKDWYWYKMMDYPESHHTD